MLDIAVSYDPDTHTCDMVFDGANFVLDTTPISRMLIALGSSRRAHPDDTLPDALSLLNPQQPSTLLARGGWPGDALDAQGRLIGSRRWLYQRSKQDEATRQAFAAADVEALTPEAQALGIDISVTETWLGPGVLGSGFVAGTASTNLQQPVG